MPEQHEREVGYEEFLAPGRDRAQARAVHTALRELAAGGAGDVLQEMARDILSGRLGLRAALRVGAYADALGEHAHTVRSAWERLDEADGADGTNGAGDERGRAAGPAARFRPAR
ncbi:hypothetical protein AB0K09_25545 [Streptomyces sp. NPDC049577]|uniref:hypothetical protein n=1 Tax=Streptomyces sp. NPDC049577 TaxID=3155153 RepID=UPI0034488A77